MELVRIIGLVTMSLRWMALGGCFDWIVRSICNIYLEKVMSRHVGYILAIDSSSKSSIFWQYILPSGRDYLCS